VAPITSSGKKLLAVAIDAGATGCSGTRKRHCGMGSRNLFLPHLARVAGGLDPALNQ